ncbi:MAG: response regulator [Nitriliruptorales bacterium]|nr:response regulator [Nitriliruptorales bacterium]
MIENQGDDAKVLIVEDDDDVIALLVELFRQEGFDPVVAEDGLEGLVKIKTGHPDIAILDIMMPDVNGVRVLEQLFEEGDGELPVPIIVITGAPDAAARSRELLGEEDVFEKPFEPSALISRMRARLAEPARDHHEEG